MTNESYRDELFELLADVSAKVVSEDQMVRLRQILETYPESREIYIEAVRLSQSGFYCEHGESTAGKLKVAVAE